VQARFVVEILTLKPQLLLNLIYGKRFNFTPRLVCRLPNDLAVDIRHLQRRADLIGVEVVKLSLILTFTLVDSGKWRIPARLVDIEAALPRRFLAQHPQALPEELLVLGLPSNFGRLANPAAQAVIPIRANAMRLAVDHRFRTNKTVFAVVGKRLQLG
jgi:hypothetical protein